MYKAIEPGLLKESRIKFFEKKLYPRSEFANQTNLNIHLIYYPPYHSKYNPVERLWGILECHWNGALLSSVEAAIEWAKTMTWKGIQSVVMLLDQIYEIGKTLTKKEMQEYEKIIIRDKNLSKWDVLIPPSIG